MDVERSSLGCKPASSSSNRLSERRGLGSLTLNQESLVSCERLVPKRSSWLGEEVIEGRRNREVGMSSEREKMSYFRSMQQQDGAETDVVTVEELSRDCPPAGLSPASSPSSKYRASLPGCSPRWPHTYHHGTIFSFPSSVSSSTSYQRRRLFYPFSSVGLLACNRYAASRRLSTVIEKPVGDVSSIEVSYPVENCALLVGVTGSDHCKANTRSSKSDQVSTGLVWQRATSTRHHFRSSSALSSADCQDQIRSSSAISSRSSHDQLISCVGREEKTTTQSLEYSEIVVALPSSHRRFTTESAYRLDNNRTTGDFCTNRARVVSPLKPSSCCGAAQTTRLDCTTPSIIQVDSVAGPIVEESCTLISELCEDSGRRNHPCDIQTMDRHSTPMTSLYNSQVSSSSPHGANTSCASIDGQLGVAASQSPSVALSGPIFTSRHYVNCKNHGMACKTCSCEACLEHGCASSGVFPRLSGSPTTSHADQQQQQQQQNRLINSKKMAGPITEPNIQSLQETLTETLPSRPARSRSPSQVLFTHSHGDAVRDRRAFSADRPLTSPLTGDKPRVVNQLGSTKVERLRQLTQRLRPSSQQSITPLPTHLDEESSLSQHQLPPIPIAPPRHPRTRSERKKSSRSKKDSATSTSDLTLPPSCLLVDPEIIKVDEKIPSLENVTKPDEAAGVCQPKGIDPWTPSLTNQVVAENLFSDKSVVSTPIPASSNDDIFDEVHLTLSKLNPRIMVGTYQQRTIPFRSASFSQIDVGADGTYNRRPRTSITLKPVTYSIGRDVTGHPNVPHSASLPRRLKISDRNPTEPTTSPNPMFCLAEDAKEVSTIHNPLLVTGSTHNPATENTFIRTCSPVDPALTDYSIQPDDKSATAETQQLISPVLMTDDGVPVNHQDPSDGVKSIVDGGEDSIATSTEASEAITQQLDSEETVPDLGLNSYETTEVSVSAEIRLSPIPNIGNILETVESDTATEADLSQPEPLTSSKPLPVLDLLELNNHLLRLRAATRDSTMDRLADLEVAAQFGETLPILSPNLDSSSGSLSRNNGVVQHGSDQLDDRPWLNQLMRIANFDRDQSGWSPSMDEGYVAESTESSSQNLMPPLTDPAVVSGLVDQQTSLPVEVPTNSSTVRELTNKRSPRSARRTSKRRRHSSTVANANLGSYRKSSKGRSLTFPLVWPSKPLNDSQKSSCFPNINGLSPLEDDGFIHPSPRQKTGVEDGQQLVVDRGLMREEFVTSPPSPDAYSDSFQPIVTENNSIYSMPKCAAHAEISLSTQLLHLAEQSVENPTSDIALDDPKCTSPYINPSSMANSQLLMEGKHYTSVESDEPEDFSCQQNSIQSELSGELKEPSDSLVIDPREETKANHRLKVSLSVTLAPETNNPSSSMRNMSLSPYCSDLESNSFGLSPEKTQRSPVNPRRYGLKRRPLRGPYGEMLEAEMNKSEFSKMYAKRNEDLNFLRELNPRINREAKSSSPRPLSPQQGSGGIHIPVNEPSTSNWSNIATNVRQNSMTLPTSHSLDDSQLKIGYNSATLPIEISGSPRHHQRSSSILGLPKRKTSANIPYELSDSELELMNSNVAGAKLLPALSSPPLDGVENKILPTLIESGAHINSMPLPSHQRTSSSPCQLVFSEGGFTSEDEPELLELTSLSSLRRSTAQLLESTNPDTLPMRLGSAKRSRDTRTHAIGELYDTERSYVDSLQILVTKYLQPLKGPECSGLVESSLVDEIFFQIPAILAHHEVFLEELRKRLESWDSKQCVGGVFLDTLTKPSVIETYTAYINHWKHAKEAIKSACSAKSAFSKFLEATAREHKGKLALDSLLIMPVQRIPRYELLIKMLLKHTSRDHPDHSLLLEAQREVHELAVKINCVEREAYGAEQQQATLRELESLVEGLGPGNLATPERTFIRHDCVTIATALGTRKERGLFLFSDLLVITSVKRRSAAMRKSSSYSTSGIASTLEANKFKLLMRLSLDDLEVTKSKEESSKRSTKDLEHLEEDLTILNQVTEMVSSLHVNHPSLDEAIKELQQGLQRQLSDKQNSSTDSQLATIDLVISTQEGSETLSVAFTSSEKRASWEESFTETKLRLRAMSPERRPPPEFVTPLPIRKTRAGLQFTCAAPTVAWNTQHLNDVWVCNSDGYVGQVCILSLHPEPNVTSCNGVCNARITCIAAIPAAPSTSDDSTSSRCIFKGDSKFESSPSRTTNSSSEIKSSVCANFELESESSSESSGSEESAEDDPSSYSRYRSNSIPLEVSVPSASEEVETTNQATMWLGTEDGCIHIYHCGENIRLKKNRTRIQQGAAVLSIVYTDNCVFASLANGDVLIYQRTSNGTWNINEPQCVTVGSIIGPVTRMLPVSGGLWCTSQNTVKILNTCTLSIDDQFAVSSDSQRSVLSLTSNGLGVWVAMQGSAVVRLFHALTHECVCDVNLAPAVNKMLSGCDDIIRQHKAACLRVTSMMVCRDLLWVGTSAGVILTIPTPHLTPTSSRLSSPPCVTGLSHGHTGHVRFLTSVEATRESHILRSSRLHHSAHHGISLKNKDTLAGVISSSNNLPSSHANRLLVISGGDGYEDFRHSGFSDSVGREDSTNHLLLWQV